MKNRFSDRIYAGAGFDRGTRFSNVGTGYDITQPSRQRRSYGFVSGIFASADRHLDKSTIANLREICRMNDRRTSLFSGILNRALDNIFGSNFDFIPNTGDETLNDIAKVYITHRMTADVCDAAGIMDFAEIGKTALRGVWNDGGSLLVKQKTGHLLPFEADQVESPAQLNGSKRIVQGIELNNVNRPTAYWVKQRHTSNDSGTMLSAFNNSKRVPARNAFFPAYRTRFNQTIGVPYLASILSFFDRTNNYLDYESLAAEGNAMMGWQIIRTDMNPSLTGTDDNPDTSSAYDQVQNMEPFMIFDFAGTGEKVEMIGATRPGENFESYLINCLRVVGVGVGMPLELLLLDFSKTNYSSARASLGEGRRMFRSWQRFCHNKFCIPWYRWQIARGIALGELPADPRLFNARVQWPAWEYIDPVKESTGNRISIEDNVKTQSEVIRERGAEPDEVFKERQREIKKQKTLGIWTEPTSPTTNKFSTEMAVLMDNIGELREIVEDMKSG